MNILFCLGLFLCIIHEVIKIFKKDYVFTKWCEYRLLKNDEEDRVNFIESNPGFMRIVRLDVFESIMLFIGCIFFFSQIKWFLSVIILSISHLQRVGPWFVVIDSIITIVCLSFATINLL